MRDLGPLAFGVLAKNSSAFRNLIESDRPAMLSKIGREVQELEVVY